MPDYVAALCRMQGGELVPFESFNISAHDDNEAIHQAIRWRARTFLPAQSEYRTWLQVLRDGKSVFSEEIAAGNTKP